MLTVLKDHWRHILVSGMPLIALGLLAVLAWFTARRSRRPFAGTSRILRKIAKYPVVPPMLVFLVSLGNGLLLTKIAGVPIPRVHDEFSYLLAGDTFAHGRMTNPTPAMWRHFETMHEIFEPTYASKFQPLQGATLALGQVLSNGPWVGAMVTNALACALMTWALRAWLRPKWALLAGLLVSVHPQLMDWGHSYWGGGVGMVGGSLVFGALGRILRGWNGAVVWSILLALGGVIIAGIRPYEGFVWGVIAGSSLLIMFIRQRARIGDILLRIALPIVCVLIPAGALQAYYDWRVTGDAMVLPYVHHAQLYMSVPLMYWQAMPPEKQYANAQLREQYRAFEYNFYVRERSSLNGYLFQNATKAFEFARSHLFRDLPLLLGLLVVPLSLGRSRWHWITFAFGIGIVISYAITPFFIAHYIGAHMPVMFALSMRGLQRLKVCTISSRLVGCALVGFCFLTTVPALALAYYTEHYDNTRGWAFERNKIEQRLASEAQDDLVFVHYDDNHNFHHEWVFNGAQIDSQRVIWARQINAHDDQELMNHYPNRRVWVVHADANPPAMEPLGPTTQSSERSSGSGSTNPASGN